MIKLFFFYENCKAVDEIDSYATHIRIAMRGVISYQTFEYSPISYLFSSYSLCTLLFSSSPFFLLHVNYLLLTLLHFFSSPRLLTSLHSSFHLFSCLLLFLLFFLFILIPSMSHFLFHSLFLTPLFSSSITSPFLLSPLPFSSSLHILSPLLPIHIVLNLYSLLSMSVLPGFGAPPPSLSQSF